MTAAAKRGPGRPTTGVPVLVRIPKPLLDDIDRIAGVWGTNRSACIRGLLHAVVQPHVSSEISEPLGEQS